ncbi:hypothetical protein MHC_04935 [Mycoplasma haemocanis str. Illinois]|uniref:Uncharacterized protein n=1 Tax=Mycoplasma haemocanis (strain Illinois) TaxID=1111676 RepID=H6N871_MYCHN|nr:hypothetical protein [Mycoplasma haemocanis]AEW45843.1 hypothetical protein MHC_04935 [Mycoplasma haemocanis str. Illinois]
MTSKVILLTSTTSVAVASGGVGIYFLSVPKSARERSFREIFKEESKRAIISTTTEDNEGWKAAVTAYKTDNTGKERDAWGLSDWSTIKSQSNLSHTHATKLKEECVKRVEMKFTGREDAGYLEVFKWCTKATQ